MQINELRWTEHIFKYIGFGKKIKINFLKYNQSLKINQLGV